MVTLPQTVVSLFFLPSFIPKMIMSDGGQGSGGCWHRTTFAIRMMNWVLWAAVALSGLCHDEAEMSRGTNTGNVQRAGTGAPECPGEPMLHLPMF